MERVGHSFHFGDLFSLSFLVLLCFRFGGSRTNVMINRNGWGHSYCMARGEILGFMQDELLRKRLSKTFSLIKNES